MQQISGRVVIGILPVLALLLFSSALGASPSIDFERGKQLFADKRYTEAVPVLNAVAAADQSLAPAAKWLVGACYRELKDYPSAISALSGALAICGANYKLETGIKQQLGLCFIATQQWAKALPVFQDVLAKRPEKAAICWYNIGRCHRELGQYAEAIEALKHVADDPSFGKDATNQLAVCYEKIGDMDKARAMLQALLAGGSTEPAGLKLRLALSYIRTHDYAQARVHLADILNNHPNDPLAKYAVVNIAGCMIKLGQADDALAFLDDLGSRRPDMAQEILVAKAETIATYANRRTEALNLIRGLQSQSLSDSLSREARYVEAILLLVDPSQTSLCAGILDGLIQEAPDDPRADAWKFHRTLCLVSDKDWSAAREAFNQFCKDYPESDYCARAKYYEGDCCARLGDRAGAKSIFAGVVSNYPGTSWAKAASVRVNGPNALRVAGAEVSQ